jgi:transposase/uncharacterized membrane protein
MLQELRVAEQRLRAVWEVLDGASVTEVARRFGVSRQSVHAWLRRYAADQGLGDRSSRPHGCPHQMSPVVEARIAEIRRAHPAWGADRIGYQLTRDEVFQEPGGTFWFSRLTEHAGYAGQLLGPMLVTACGLGLVFVPLSLVALHNVAEQDSGVASSLLNTGQQVGGAIGLALLGTVAWTTVAESVSTQLAHAAEAAAKAGQPLPKQGIPPPASIYDHALAIGFSRGFLVSAGIALLALLVAIATIRVRRQELTGAVPAPQGAAPEPVTVQQHEDRAALAAVVRPCRFC